MDIKNILFVCTGNTCRSPMAEGICNVLMKELGITAKSAGLSVLMPTAPSKNAIIAASEYGADISKHEARQLSEDDVKCADLVLTMTGTHKMMIKTAFPYYSDKVYTMYEYALGKRFVDVSDPYGGSYDIYKSCCDEIYSLTEKIKNKIQE